MKQSKVSFEIARDDDDVDAAPTEDTPVDAAEDSVQEPQPSLKLKITVPVVESEFEYSETSLMVMMAPVESSLEELRKVDLRTSEAGWDDAKRLEFITKVRIGENIFND